MNDRTITSAWAEALARYEGDAARVVSASTLRARMGRLRRLAVDLGETPDAVTRERFESWTALLPCSLSTTGEYVQAARAFYRWAMISGVAGESPVPSAETRSRYHLSEQWADALAAFERSQKAARIATETARRRLQHLKRFASEIGRTPWHVAPEDFGAWIIDQGDGARHAAARDSLRAFYRWAAGAGRIAEDPTAEPSRRGSSLGVPESWGGDLRAWQRWLNAHGTARLTIELRASHLGTFARAHSSADPFGITADDLFDYMAGKQWSRETRRSNRASLRSFYRWAKETGRTSIDPTELIPRVKAAEPVARPASDADYIAAVQAARDPRWALALRMACELGMRRSEVAQVHSSDILHDDAGRVSLLVHGKGGKGRWVPVPSNLAAAIARFGEGYLFPSRDGEHLTPRHVGKQVSKLLPKGVTMHALRHAFATRVYNVNRDVFALQQLLGHASAGTTQRYVKVSQDRMRELVEAVAW